jgi:hypothetical protein
LKTGGLSIEPQRPLATARADFGKPLTKHSRNASSELLAARDIERSQQETYAQIRQGFRMPDRGSRDVLDVLQLSRRSSGPVAYTEPLEMSSRREAAHSVWRVCCRKTRRAHGVRAPDCGVEDLTAIAGSEAIAERRRKGQRRNRSHRRN